MRFAVLFCSALALCTTARTTELTLKIPPVKTSFDAGGQKIGITAWAAISGASPDKLHLAVTADLRDLQEKITPILAAELNRSERCGERLTVESASLAPASPAALLTVAVHYERWGCAKLLGKETVMRLVGGNGVVDVKLTPVVAPEGISVASEVTRIEADGSLGELLSAGSLGTTLRDKIAHSIQSAIQKALNLRSTLPPEVANVATLQSVQFSDGGQNRLWLNVRGEVRLSAEQLRALTK
jgi:hypothetical protein